MSEFDAQDRQDLLSQAQELRRQVKELQALKQQCVVDKTLIEHEKNKAQQYLDIAGVIILVLDTKGRIIVANKKASDILGLPQSELIGQDWFAGFVPPAQRNEVRKKFQSIISGQAIISPQTDYYENSILAANKEERVVFWHNTVIRDDKGNIVASLSSGEDVTERKLLEEARVQNLVFYRSLVRTSPDAIFLYNTDSNLVMVNQRAAALFGFEKKEEAIGRNIFDFIDPCDHNRARQNIKLLIKDNSLVETEYKLLRKDGTAFVGDVNSTAVRGSDGLIQALMGVVRDITERKNAEEALRESEKRFRDIFENASDGIILADPSDGRFYDSNQAMCAMLGYSRQELLQMAFEDIHPFESLAYAKEQFRRITDREIERVDDMPVKRKDGSVFYASISSYPITISGKYYVIGLFRDITKVKQAELQAELARRNAERANKAIKSIVEASASFIGQDFFKAIVVQINKTLDAQYTFIGVRDKDTGDTIKTIALCVESAVGDNFEYALAGTPCEGVLTGGCCVYPEKVCERFPDDELLQELDVEGYVGVPLTNSKKEIIGLLVSLYEEPIENIDFVKTVLEMFAYRVSTELERERDEESLREAMVRERTLEAIEESRDYLDKVINVAGDPIFVKDRNHKWVLLNDAYCDFIGYSREELLGKSDYDYFPKRQADIFWNRDEIVFETGKVNVNEEEFTDSSGKVHIIVTKKTLHVDNNGKKFIVGVIRDITEQKVTARALQDSEEKFRKLVASADDAIMIFEAKSKKFTEVNRSAEKLYGYNRKEFHQLTIFDISNEPQATERALEKILLGDPLHIAIRYHKKKDGTVFPVEITASSFTVNDKNVVCVIVRDITERKRIEEERLRHERLEGELRERKKSEQALLFTQFSVDKAAESIFWVNQSGLFVYVNEKACLSLGYAKEKLLSMSIFDIDINVTKKTWAKHWQDIKKEKTLFFESYQKKSDAAVFPVEVTSNYLEFDGRSYNCILARDISERKEAQEKIRRNNEFLENTINSLTHPFYVIDADTYLVKMANKASGINEFEAPVRCHEAIHNSPVPCEGDDLVCPLREVKKTKVPVMFEHRHYDKRGNERIVEIYAYPVLNKDGDVYEVIEYTLDITERKKTEELLRQSETALKSIVRVMPAAIGLIKDRIIDWVSDGTVTMLGYSFQELYGQSTRILYENEEEFQRVGVVKYEGVKKYGHTALETRWLCKNGEVIDVWLSLAPMDINDLSRGIVFAALDITQPKQAAAALEEALETSSSIVKSIPAGLFIYKFDSPDTLRLLSANPAALLLTGKNLDQIIGKNFNEIWPLAEVSGITQNFLDVARSGRVYHIEKLPYKDERIEGIFAVQVFSMPGARIGVAFENITAREKAQRNLLYAKFFVDHMNDMGMWIDGQGSVFYANEAVRQRLGYSSKELYAMKIHDIDVHFPEELWQSQWEEMKRKQSALLETSFQSKDGSRFPVEISSNLMECEGSEYLCVIARDLTERERAEEALRQSEQDKTMILDTLSELVVYHDKNMRILWANKTARQDAGSTHQQLVGQHCYAAWCNRKSPCKGCPVHRSLESGVFEQGEVTAADGASWFLRAYPIKNKDGEITGVVEVGLNVSQQKKAEQDSQLNIERSRRILEETVVALAATAERRDPYTAGHQRRVAQLACAIAKELELDENIIEGIRMAAIIHDVGKVYVPSEILSKPSKLTDLEMSIIKTHPQIGYEILEPVEFPWPVALIVLQHHERLDGSGYPLGIIGKDILYESKVLIIADVVEAMASHRPYRAAIGINEALKEITANKGKFYDEPAVDACVKLFKKKKFAFE